jgi:hypothetical protein
MKGKQLRALPDMGLSSSSTFSEYSVSKVGKSGIIMGAASPS